MKRMLVLCMTPECSTVLWSMEWDTDNPEFLLYETTGSCDGHEMCGKCRKEEQSKPKPMIKFKNPRVGEVSVQKPSDFQDLMAKRKVENRKASGKGAPRGQR